MPNAPLVSIIVPSFNQGVFIRDTVQSCLDQDYRPIEIIVVDGASTDNTVEVLKSFGDIPELKWVSEPDKGVVDAVNKGLTRASGEMAGIQSSDDFYLPGAIKTCVKKLQKNPKVSFVFGDIIKINADGYELSRHVLEAYSLENLLSGKTWIPQPACFFRLEAAREAGGWRRGVPYAADTDLWFRMALTGSAEKIDRFISKRRMHENQRDTHGDRILRDYSKMIDDLFCKFGADPALRPLADKGVAGLHIRYGTPEAYAGMNTGPRKYTLRQLAGCLIHDVPRTQFVKHWTFARNRSNQLTLSREGVDTRPLGNWSEDLYAPKVFPVIGKNLMRRALKQWPVRFSATPVCMNEPQVTFIIPFRGSERLPHLRATVQSVLAQRNVGVRCLVVEQSVKQVAGDLPPAVEVIHLPHPTDPESWRKSWAFNEGVRRAETEFVVCHDADIPVPAGYAELMVRRAEDDHVDVLHVQRFLFCLTKEHTQQLLSGPLEKISAVVPQRIRQNWQGGTVALRRETFFKLGGFDERFVNWGGEDNEFYDRCRTQRTCYSGVLPFVHLWHPEQPFKYAADREANLREMKRLLNLPPQERILDLKERGAV